MECGERRGKYDKGKGSLHVVESRELTINQDVKIAEQLINQRNFRRRLLFLYAPIMRIGGARVSRDVRDACI